ncbi:MAG: hypothetical protein METHP_00245 [Methanoregula sp. SKADARSKE-2]|nr:MAG: hypothetical protein METHP_00245 [Methanoregula sp. SKADARSKE-2]
MQHSNTLRNYLNKTGNGDRRVLNLSFQGGNIRQLPVSLFSDNATVGYFFAVEHPICSEREDYFIEYYGVFNATHDSDNLASLSKFMSVWNSDWAFGGLAHEIR